jgi:Na+-translocating ferredoxin:NAD+ oxidoreductase RnfD subunit
MSAHAAPAPRGRTLSIRGTAYPVLLPKLSDPRLHLAAVITSLQVLGQVAFGFRLSIAQILLSLATCAVLEVGIAAWRQHVLMWPASALLTGNGVAFILRVPGTEHGDWWSLRGWWIFVATAAVSLLSKHVVVWRGGHVFNPSNFGLVLCFLVLGRDRVEPLDFWWGPMSWWMGLALAIIVAGGFAILSRLKLLRIAIWFWLSFAAGIAVLAAVGHDMTARWHLGPITGAHFWWVLLTSPEVLVFLFFMITDPKTAPRAPRARVVYAVALGLGGALLIAPTRTEWASKVGLLSALFVVCAAMPVLAYVPRRRLLLAAAAAALAYPFALVAVGNGPGAATAEPGPAPARRVALPPIAIAPSKHVQTKLTLRTARPIVRDLVAAVPARGRRVTVHLEPGGGQDPPVAVAELAGRSYRLTQLNGRWRIANAAGPRGEPKLGPVKVLAGYRLTDVAAQVGLDFRQGAFRYGVTNDTPAMMGGGLCVLDYDGDGWMDLFVVNSYGEGDIGAYSAHGGLPRTALYRNDHGRFVDVSRVSRAGRTVRGEGCVAADFNGDGHTDLYVTTAQDDELLWNNGDGTFTEGARSHGVVSYGWHSGAAVADVNGDGRPDLFVAGYAEPNGPIPGSTAGFPTNHYGVRDLLFLNEGNGRDGRARFREVGRRVGIDLVPYDHSLGALFTDVNGDGRPDLYVANDEDPNRLYVNERGGPLGFRFLDRAPEEHVADANAGMGIAEGDGYLFVSNSRRQTHAVYTRRGKGFADVRRSFASAFGTNLTGWGDSWVDLRNDAVPELALANGAIPVKSLAKDARPPQVLTMLAGDWVDTGILRGLSRNARGLVAFDYDNDGRVDLAINTIGGRLVLLHTTSDAGHWLEVRLARFAPGAVVTAKVADGPTLRREVHAGSSYLSSEDPRVHFGLGDGTRVAELTVRYRDGTTTRLRDVRADRVVSVR